MGSPTVSQDWLTFGMTTRAGLVVCPRCQVLSATAPSGEHFSKLASRASGGEGSPLQASTVPLSFCVSGLAAYRPFSRLAMAAARKG